MFYTLMRKNDIVAPVNVDEFGKITTLIAQPDAELLPVGIREMSGMTISNISAWWCQRAIPFDRDGFHEAVEHLDIGLPEQFCVRSYGVSLTDSYWLKPNGSDLTWEQVNLYDNYMSQDVGKLLFGETKEINNYHSPDCTTDGFLKKRWDCIMGNYYLMKAGSGENKQEPFGEVVVSRLLYELNIPHVRYDLIWKSDGPYSMCENFATKDMEFIPAYRIYETAKKPNDKDSYQHFKDCCIAMGVGDCTDVMNQMFAIDYIVSNTDRHLGNFGFMRNFEKSVFNGSAPVFDNGNSLFYQTPTESINPKADVPQKPFGSSQHDTLSLITDFSWLEFGKLSCLSEIIKETSREYIQNGLMSEERVQVIANATIAKAAYLEQIALGTK